MSNITALMLNGSSNVSTNDISPIVDFSNIVTDIYEVKRSQISLSNVASYIVIEYDINQHITTQFNSYEPGKDDAWGLCPIHLKFENIDNSSNNLYLYDLSNVTIHLPTENKEIVVAQINVDIIQDPSNNIDMDTVTSEHTVLDLCCNIGLKSDGHYSLTQNDVLFNGDLVTYILKENPAEFQIAGYKIEGTTDASSSSALLKAHEFFDGGDNGEGGHNGNNNNDYLQATLSTTSNLSVPNVNQTLLKEWYKDSIDTLINMVEGEKTIVDISFTFIQIDYDTNSSLSKWARSKIIQDISGNAVWADDSTRCLDNPFSEGEYIICSSTFSYKPNVTDICGIHHEYNSNNGNQCYVVLKQKTGKNSDYYNYGLITENISTSCFRVDEQELAAAISIAAMLDGMF